MKPIDFELHRPETLQQAVDLLAEYGEDAKVLAGGQSLVPLLNFRLARPEHLVDLSRVAALGQMRRTPGELIVGAMVRHAHAEHSPGVAGHAPLLGAAMPNIAHPPIRNRGTVGGSVAHGDPAGELPAVVGALDATIVATGPSGRREVGGSEFFHGNLVTSLASDEILTEIRFPAAAENTGAVFLEVARRQGDFALVGVGVQVTVSADIITEARICFSGVSEIPRRATEAEQLLAGHPFSDEICAAAVASIRGTIHPNDDLHASGEYRADVAGVLMGRALTVAHHRASGTHPASNNAARLGRVGN